MNSLTRHRNSYYCAVLACEGTIRPNVTTPPDDTTAQAPARAGTQSIERTVRILTALASHGISGWTLPDLARHCQLDRGTVRRILLCLVGERLARYRPSDRHYLAGPFLYELSLSLPHYREFERTAISALERLPLGRDIARFLCFRSGDEFVCAARLCGASQGYSLHEGARRPMASSAAGIAMLVGMPCEKGRALFDASLAAWDRSNGGPSAAALKTLFDLSLQAGFGKNEGLLSPGWHSYAVAVRNQQGEPFASLMVTATASELSPERAGAACAALKAAAAELEQAVTVEFR